MLRVNQTILFGSTGGEPFESSRFTSEVLFVVLILIPLCWPYTDPSDRAVVHNQFWLWVYLTNVIDVWRGQWLFGSPRISMNHFWSLAIEEQFYWVWPVVVLVCPRKTLIQVCAAIMFVALCLRIITCLQGDILSWYILTPCRLDTLAAGSWAALAIRGPGGLTAVLRPCRRIAVVCLFGLLVIAARKHCLSRGDIWVETIGLSLLAGLFAALLPSAAAATTESLTGRFWTSWSLRTLGRYSYGLYVYHHLLAPVYDALFPVGRLTGWLGSRPVSVLTYMVLAWSISLANGCKSTEFALSAVLIEIGDAVQDLFSKVADDRFIRIAVRTSLGETGPLHSKSSHYEPGFPGY